MISSLIGIIASSGGVAETNSYESISTTTVGAGGVSSVTFSSIPSTYQHLQIRCLVKDTGTTYGTGLQVSLRMNSDSGSNYTYHNLKGQGSSASAGGTGNGSQLYNGYYPGSLSNTSSFGVIVMDILDYGDTNKFKTARALSGDDLNGSGTVALTSGSWRSTSAITSIQLLPNDVAFAQYSSFALYGIKG